MGKISKELKKERNNILAIILGMPLAIGTFFAGSKIVREDTPSYKNSENHKFDDEIRVAKTLGDMNIRISPGITSESIGNLRAGEYIVIDGAEEHLPEGNGDYYWIKFHKVGDSNIKGFVATRAYIVNEDSSVTEQPFVESLHKKYANKNIYTKSFVQTEDGNLERESDSIEIKEGSEIYYAQDDEAVIFENGKEECIWVYDGDLTDNYNKANGTRIVKPFSWRYKYKVEPTSQSGNNINMGSSKKITNFEIEK